MSRKQIKREPEPTTRRDFLAKSSGMAALSALAAGCDQLPDWFPGKEQSSPGAAVPPPVAVAPTTAPSGSISQGPFDSIRDYVDALDALGLLMRVPRIDQDSYHATALVLRTIERFGISGSPAIAFENITVNGRSIAGPLLANLAGHWNMESLIWGLPPIAGDRFATYRQARAHMSRVVGRGGGRYPSIPPREIDRGKAPCKRTVLTGEQVNLLNFPFIQSNPADSGRSINSGSVFSLGAERGSDFSTYTCQIVGPRQLRISAGKDDFGYQSWMAARERGEQTAKVSIVVGQDPVVSFLSGTSIARQGQERIDKLAIAGGMRGKAIDVVRSETSDVMVPAHAEMIIEGEIPLQAELVQTGPFSEVSGYQGSLRDGVFTLNVSAVTHRPSPWIVDSFPGLNRSSVTAPIEAFYDRRLRELVPNMIEFHCPQNAMGVAFMSIDKAEPFQGMAAGRAVANGMPMVKVLIVVDKVMNVLDLEQMLFAAGSRWQPFPASEIIVDAAGSTIDPSQPLVGRTSKMVIDATSQWMDEGGPKKFPELTRTLLDQGAPKAVSEVNTQYGGLLRSWRAV
jgi:4-hydroxy-3-polyprenylbenzoate decarboxylase